MLRTLPLIISGRAGIAGNETMDQMAAAAALTNTVDITIPDTRPKKTWQVGWSTQTNNKLHIIKPRLGRCTTDSHNIFIDYG